MRSVYRRDGEGSTWTNSHSPNQRGDEGHEKGNSRFNSEEEEEDSVGILQKGLVA